MLAGHFNEQIHWLKLGKKGQLNDDRGTLEEAAGVVGYV